MVARDLPVDLDPVAGRQDHRLVEALEPGRVFVGLREVVVVEGEPFEQLDRRATERDAESEDPHGSAAMVAAMAVRRARDLGIRIGAGTPGPAERDHRRGRCPGGPPDRPPRRRRCPRRRPHGRHGGLPARRPALGRPGLRGDPHPQRLRRADRRERDPRVGDPREPDRPHLVAADRQGLRRHRALDRGPRPGRGRGRDAMRDRVRRLVPERRADVAARRRGRVGGARRRGRRRRGGGLRRQWHRDAVLRLQGRHRDGLARHRTASRSASS